MKKMIVLLSMALMLGGCMSNKTFTYTFDKTYVPLVGESANDPAPWPH